MRKVFGEQLSAMGLQEPLPRHVGLILDGNGRWAKSRGLPRIMGHRAGMERLRGIITLSADLGIEVLSLYAFSTENWRRPEMEVKALFSLLEEYFLQEIEELHEKEVCIRIMGDLEALPASTQGAAMAAMVRTAQNQGLVLNIALNYGSRAEVLRAFRLLQGETVLTEAKLMAALYTAGLPDLDLIIRTAGEKRLSNFMLLQAAYAEFLFAEENWPDFSDARYIAALCEYQSRVRKFGGV